MIGSSLVLVLIVLFGLANQSFSQFCDILDQGLEQCISLPTSMVCGTPSVTGEQVRQAQAATAIIRAIEQIGGPIFEGSPEAAQLGISVDNPIVDLTFAQQNFYRKCESSNLLTTVAEDFPEEGNFSAPFRRKRQIQSNVCCSASPNTVRILVSVDENGRAVQLVQPPGLAQVFQDTTTCPTTTCSGQITCGAVNTLFPAEVLFLRPAALARANIVVTICGAITSTPAG